MKVKITERGIFRDDGTRYAFGEIVEIEGDALPKKFVNRCRILDDAERFAVTNPAEGGLQQPVGDFVDTRLAEFEDALNVMAADGSWDGQSKPDVRDLNKHIAEGVEPFTAAERDACWAAVLADQENRQSEEA